MDRRRFLTTLLGTTLAGALPAVPAARAAPRSALIVHALVVPKAAGALSADARLELRHVDNDMGHHHSQLLLGERPVAATDSGVVGGLLERGEPLSARVTSLDSGALRIDILLDRPLARGERLALQDPRSARCGFLFQRVPVRHRVDRGWLPLRAVPGAAYRVRDAAAPPARSRGEGYLCAPGDRVLPPDQLRRRFPAASPDLEATAIALGHGTLDLAFLVPRLDDDLGQLLLRGERLQGRVLGENRIYPGALDVRVELVA
jgi:hypothetical protein